jgi:hypothetical protein
MYADNGLYTFCNVKEMTSLFLMYSGVPRNFVAGVQQIQLRAEDRENGDLEAVALQSGVLEAAVIWYKKFHFI